MATIQVEITDLSPTGSAAGLPGAVAVSLADFAGARVLLLEHGITTPPDGTPAGTILFQKGA